MKSSCKNLLNDIQTILSKSNTIHCSKHKTNKIISYCFDCNDFFCLDPSCGYSHVFHSIENVSHLLNSMIIPTLTNLIEINKNQESTSEYIISLNKMKAQLKEYAISEKTKIKNAYQQILSLLKKIYLMHLSQIDIFMESINSLFTFSLKYFTCKNELNLSTINTQIQDLINNSNNIERFLLGLIKNIKQFIPTVNENYFSLQNRNKIMNTTFEKIKFAIKQFSEDNYGLLDEKNISFYNEINMKLNEEFSFLKNRKEFIIKTIDNNMIKFNNEISQLCNNINIENENNTNLLCCSRLMIGNNIEIDLDLFSREFYLKINNYRFNPNPLIEYIISIKSENKISSINRITNYLQSKHSNKKNSLEWDNDLSNSAEDFFTSYNSHYIDTKTLTSHIKNILIESYYSDESYLNHLNSLIVINTKPNIEDIILHLLLNEQTRNPNTKEHPLFDSQYNLIGISTVPYANKNNNIYVNIIINLGYFPHKYLNNINN